MKRFTSIILLSCCLLGAFALMFSVKVGTSAAVGSGGKKNAYVNGASAPDNGTASSPVKVDLADKITYTITVDNEKSVTQEAKYDVMFVLDWSGSMSDGYMDAAWTRSALFYERNIMMDVSDYIFANYPQSRVALLGMNSLYNNKNEPNEMQIQLQRDFMTEAQYRSNLSSIQSGFFSNYFYTNDDNAQFLAAAVDTMLGIKTAYGSSLSAAYGNPVWTIPRTASDLSERIPVIVHISDFQLPDSIHWTRMGTQASRLKQAYPESMLLTVRLDHSGNAQKFDTTACDNEMLNKITKTFTKVAYNTSYTTALSNIKTYYLNNVPVEKNLGSMVSDRVPAGLEVDQSSISQGGTYNPSTRTITWDLTNAHAGEITVSFKATVTEPGKYINTAQVKHSDNTGGATNATYHIYGDLVQAALTKILKLPVGTTAPDATFTFTATKMSLDDKTGDADKALMPALNSDNLRVVFSAADGSVDDPVDGIVSIVVETGDLFEEVVFPRAGVYVYEITEDSGTNSAIDANIDHETLTYSGAKYTLAVYVENNTTGTGTHVSSVVTIVTATDVREQTVGDKVDPTPGGDGENYDYSQMIFTNTYVKTNGSPDPDEPDPVNDATLSVSKTVVGAFANKERYFDYGIGLTVPSLVADVPAYYRAYVVANDVVISPADNADSSLIGTDFGGSYLMISTSGETAFKLKHGQRLVFVDTPVGTSYDVSELTPASYIPSYIIATSNVYAPEVQGNLNMTLEAKSQLVGELVNKADFTNTHDFLAPTGLSMKDLPFIGLILLAIGALIAYPMVKSHRRSSSSSAQAS